MLDYQHFEPRHGPCVTTDFEFGVDQVLERPQPQSVQSSGLAGCPIGVGELLECAPPPARQRLGQHSDGTSTVGCRGRMCHRLLKHRRVQLAGINTQRIAPRTRHEPAAIGAEQLAQLVDRRSSPLPQPEGRHPTRTAPNDRPTRRGPVRPAAGQPNCGACSRAARSVRRPPRPRGVPAPETPPAEPFLDPHRCYDPGRRRSFNFEGVVAPCRLTPGTPDDTDPIRESRTSPSPTSHVVSVFDVSLATELALISPIQTIIDTLPDEEWFTQIRHWHNPEFGAADSWYWYLDGVGMSPLRASLPERVERSKRPFGEYSMAGSKAPDEQLVSRRRRRSQAWSEEPPAPVMTRSPSAPKVLRSSWIVPFTLVTA